MNNHKRPFDFPHLEQGSEEWLAVRREMTATCSMYAACINCNPHCGRAKAWRLLTGRETIETNSDMQFGIDHEDTVVDMYAQIFAGKSWSITSYGFREDPDMPGFGGSVDRIVENRGTGEKWVLEIKTTLYGQRGYVPLYHVIQCIGQCEAMKLPFADYFCWAPGDAGHELYGVRIKYDKQAWDIIKTGLLYFRDTYLVPDKKPKRSKNGQRRKIADALTPFIHYEEIR